MNDDVIRWVVRTCPNKRLSGYLASHYRKNMILEWRRVDVSAGQNLLLTEDFIFTPIGKSAAIMKINDRYYSGWRKAKGEIKKILQPVWHRVIE